MPERDPRSPQGDIETRLKQAAGSFPYPPTPDLAARERQRILAGRDGSPAGSRAYAPVPSRLAPRRGLAALVVIAILVLLSSLLLVTPVRARLVEWLRIGAIEVIFTSEQTPSPAPLPTALHGLSGETSLTQLTGQPPFPLRLPAYPTDLGAPQHVYLQQPLGTPMVIFTWNDPAQPASVALALYQIGPGETFLEKWVQNAQETSVNGQPALWVEGPYLLQVNDGEAQARRIVQGRALIWTENGITYRLETGLSLPEAQKIAASLRPLVEK